MFRKNQPSGDRVSFTHYPLHYVLRQGPDYHYNRRNISGFMEEITFDPPTKDSTTNGHRFHIVTGEETYHTALRHIHNKRDSLFRQINLDTLDPPTKAVIEGWSGQNNNDLTTVFGNTEISSETPDDRVELIIDSLRLSVLSLGITIAKLDLDRQSMPDLRHPLRGRFKLPVSIATINHDQIETELKAPRINSQRLMVSTTLDMPTNEVARLVDQD